MPANQGDINDPLQPQRIDAFEKMVGPPFVLPRREPIGTTLLKYGVAEVADVIGKPVTPTPEGMLVCADALDIETELLCRALPLSFADIQRRNVWQLPKVHNVNKALPAFLLEPIFDNPDKSIVEIRMSLQLPHATTQKHTWFKPIGIEEWRRNRPDRLKSIDDHRAFPSEFKSTAQKSLASDTNWYSTAPTEHGNPANGGCRISVSCRT
jgi:hypothetical protein